MFLEAEVSDYTETYSTQTTKHHNYRSRLINLSLDSKEKYRSFLKRMQKFIVDLSAILKVFW